MTPRRHFLLGISLLPIAAVATAPACDGDSALAGSDDRAPAVPVKPLFMPLPTPSEQAVRAALRKNVTLEFQETPLGDVIDDFRGQFGINIVTDQRALRDQGIDLGSPVNLSVKEIRFESALKLILSQFELHAFQDSEVLLITGGERSARMFTRVYLSAGVVWGDEFELEGFLEMVRNTVASATWQENGGEGRLDLGPFGHTIVVTQTPEVHGQVVELFTQLREANRSIP